MRSLRRDKRGISPIIATILLIAVTAVAAGVIAAFATNLFVPSTSLRVMSCTAATVYDYDNTAQNENYRNGNISIILRVETGTYRSIGDAAYGGTSVTVSNPLTGFTISVSFPDNTSSWGSSMTGVGVATFGTGSTGWTGGITENSVKMLVTLTPDSQGRLTAGSSISILIEPCANLANAHENASSRMTKTQMWDEGDQMTVTFTDRDSATFSGYDARLYGSAWVV